MNKLLCSNANRIFSKGRNLQYTAQQLRYSLRNGSSPKLLRQSPLDSRNSFKNCYSSLSQGAQKSASRPSGLNSVYYLFGAFGVSSFGIFLYYKYERHQHVLEHNMKSNRTSPIGFLQPDFQKADTYEMGLFLQSEKELKQQEEEKRQPPRNSNIIVRVWYRCKFAVLDYVIEPIAIVGRFYQLLFIFSPLLVTFPIFQLSKIFLNNNWVLISDESFYSVLLWCLQTAGPSFIKLGQWAASRTDIFDEKLCSTLGQLHSNVKPHKWKYTKEILCKNLKIQNLEEIFEEIDEIPIGCGAIGQVYLGVLKRDRQQIAIKIQHPGVKKMVDHDLKIIKFFASSINSIPTMEWLSLPDEADQFAFFMKLQLDFRIECCNLWKFNSQYKMSPSIKFPKYYQNYTTREVLFEEYMDNGISMEKFLAMKNLISNDFRSTVNADSSSKDKKILHDMIPLYKRISDPFIDCFLDMLITYDFIHADLHPGNVILKFWDPTIKKFVEPRIINDLLETYEQCVKQKDHDLVVTLRKKLTHILSDYDPKVCLIDVGLVTELNKRNRINFIALFNALAQFDGIKAGNLMIERSRTPETAINKEVFAEKVSKMMNTVKKRTFTLGSISIGDLLEQMLSMVRSHHVRMEGDFVSVVVAILLLEGIGQQLDPDLDLFARSLPMLREFGSRQEGREALMAASDGNFLSMFKIWIALELKNILTTSVKELNDLILTDQLSPFY